MSQSAPPRDRINAFPGPVAARLIDSVRQHPLDQVEKVNDRVRLTLIGEDRANLDNQISRCVVECSLTALALHGA